MYFGSSLHQPVAASLASQVRRRGPRVPGVRHRQVAGQQVEERRDVGRALDGRVAAQREDAAAGPADVAEEELEDRRRADVLHADRVLRPADRVEKRARALAAASCRTGPRRRAGTGASGTPQISADLRGRVAGEVALQDLEDAARVLERRVPLLVRSISARATSPPAPGSAKISLCPAAGTTPSTPSYCQRRDVVAAASRDRSR